ncbi:MAG: acyl carrier protein [Actinomycetota bacterium]|nr:acyl carrier protein [Actinomycetota bacterium]MDQ2958001.1 acyl carrier protein [Actinomycetota bacterium]
MNLTEEIADFVVSEFAPDSDARDLDSNFDLIQSGVVSSLGLLRLVSWIGEEYQIPVGNLALDPKDFQTVSSIQQFVLAHQPSN